LNCRLLKPSLTTVFTHCISADTLPCRGCGQLRGAHGGGQLPRLQPFQRVRPRYRLCRQDGTPPPFPSSMPASQIQCQICKPYHLRPIQYLGYSRISDQGPARTARRIEGVYFSNMKVVLHLEQIAMPRLWRFDVSGDCLGNLNGTICSQSIDGLVDFVMKQIGSSKYSRCISCAGGTA